MGVMLRPYQEEARRAILKEWTEHDKTLLVLPTGCGKTVVFADVAKQRTTSGRVLVLAHREELLAQAADKIKNFCGLECSVEKAEQTAIGRTEPITVGSVQTLQSDKRLERFPSDYFSTVIVDEAHHSLANSYQKVLRHFDNAKVLGVTATPDRGDMRELSTYFESLAYEYSLRDAVNQGYLSKIRVQTIPLDIDLRKVKISKGDFQEGEVGEALKPYLEDIADEMAKVCMDRHTIVFLPLVAISQEFRDILNDRGFRAAEVNGNSKNRDEILQEFAEGKYNVLCNSMLLTEGWDCPIVDCIVVLRPTKIRALYCQMVGRGTRLYPGKDHLLILDFLWMTGKHNLIHPADIICKNNEIAEKVTAKLKDGKSTDLMDAENNVIEERKEALRNQLASSERQRRIARIIDPLGIEEDLNDDDLIDYVPTFGWEQEPSTEKQLSTLQKFGIDTQGKKICKGRASITIDKEIKRRKAGLSTLKQAKLLKRQGFKNTYDWKFEEADKIIKKIKAVNYRMWLLPDPASYVPPSLKEDKND